MIVECNVPKFNILSAEYDSVIMALLVCRAVLSVDSEEDFAGFTLFCPNSVSKSMLGGPQNVLYFLFKHRGDVTPG